MTVEPSEGNPRIINQCQMENARPYGKRIALRKTAKDPPLGGLIDTDDKQDKTIERR